MVTVLLINLTNAQVLLLVLQLMVQDVHFLSPVATAVATSNCNWF